MNSVYITAIICATVTALAWMFYDLRRRRIAAADKRARTRTIEKEVFVEVPVFHGREAAAPEAIEAKTAPKRKGSLKGIYVDKDGVAQPITGRSGRNGETG